MINEGEEKVNGRYTDFENGSSFVRWSMFQKQIVGFDLEKEDS
jgi:hypothetical protein